MVSGEWTCSSQGLGPQNSQAFEGSGSLGLEGFIGPLIFGLPLDENESETAWFLFS